MEIILKGKLKYNIIAVYLKELIKKCWGITSSTICGRIIPQIVEKLIHIIWKNFPTIVKKITSRHLSVSFSVFFSQVVDTKSETSTITTIIGVIF